MSYADTIELKNLLGRKDALGDVLIDSILEYASKTIDRFCNRQKLSPHANSNGWGFIADPVANTRTYVGSGVAIQRIDECAEVTLVEVKDSATDEEYDEWDSDDWLSATGGTRRVIYDRLPYTLLVVTPQGSESHFTSGTYLARRGFTPDILYPRNIPTVRVTAKWGYAVDVPGGIRMATIMQAVRWHNRIKGGMSDALASSDLGALLFTQKLDPDVQAILKDGRFVRPV